MKKIGVLMNHGLLLDKKKLKVIQRASNTYLAFFLAL